MHKIIPKIIHTLPNILFDIFRNGSGRFLPQKPCSASLIFENKVSSSDEEFDARSIQQWRALLSDSLFDKVEYAELVFVDHASCSTLPDIVSSIIQSFRNLQRLELVLNPRVIPHCNHSIVELSNLVAAAGIQLQATISNHTGAMAHNQPPVTDDSLDKAAGLIMELTQKGVPVSVRLTLTTDNLYFADDVLLRLLQHRSPDFGSQPFRIKDTAFELTPHPQPHFTPEQRFHLITFFDKLTRLPELSLAQRLYYKSLVNQLAYGKPRSVSCAWRSNTITLDLAGNILVCPVQSTVLGSAFGDNAWQTYRKSLSQRNHILQQSCRDCHYHDDGLITTGQFLSRSIEVIKGRVRRTITRKRPVAAIDKIYPAKVSSPKGWKHVLITGWYGTETTGDKAILAEVVHYIQSQSPGCRVSITSIDQKISRQTNLELPDIHHARLVDLSKAHQAQVIEAVDAVIIGGGPLMETQAMWDVHRIFQEANRQQKARVIFGCGIGPLHSDEMRQITTQILRLTTAGFFRDEQSYEYARKHASDQSFAFACDPALAYLKRWLAAHDNPIAQHGNPLRIATLLRGNTGEFIVGKTRQELGELNRQSALKIAAVLESVAERHSAQVSLLAMNTPWVGGDDRMFNRLVASYCSPQTNLHIARAYCPLDQVIQTLASADVSVAMRYHGHLFCMALGIPFLSVDYSGKSGKVYNLTHRIGYERGSVPWNEFDIDQAIRCFCEIINERVYWSGYLMEKTNHLVEQLQHTYTEVFGEQPV
jgi:polysaccharide pyruvyl transferase WcaK-like protein